MSGGRAIPRVPPSPDGERLAFDQAVKERLERIAGVRGGKLANLDSGATTAQIIEKINEIIELLQP